METLEKETLKQSSNDFTEPVVSLIDQKLLVAAVKLKNQGRLVNFACGMKVQIEEYSLHSFKVKELNENLQIPVTLQNIEIIKKTSEKALGLLCSNGFCMPAETSRHNQVTSSCFSALEDPYLASLVSSHLQLPTKLINIAARVKNLMLHEYGGKSYINNFCSCCIDRKFGTVFLQLPVEGGHKGGRLNVEYKGRKEVFETHASSDKNFFISAFYDCCEHFTEPVTQGYKLTVIYDLIWTNAKTNIPREFPVFLTSLKQVKVALKTWTKRYAKNKNCAHEESLSSDSEIDEDSSEEVNVNNKSGYLYTDKELRENVLFFVLQERYDTKSLSFKILRDQDQTMAEFLLNCIFLDVHLAVATLAVKNINKVDSCDVRPYSQAGAGTNEETATVAFSRLIDSNDVARNMRLELNWNRQFVGLEPHQEKNVYNRNPEDKTEIGKILNNRCVLLIWPKHHSTQIFCRYGVLSHLPENSIQRCEWQEEPPIYLAPKSNRVIHKNDSVLPSWACLPVSKLPSLPTTPQTTPPVGWTLPRIRTTDESRFDNYDLASNAWASRTPRAESSSSTMSSGQDWATENRSHEARLTFKARTSTSAYNIGLREQKLFAPQIDMALPVWKSSIKYKDMDLKVTMEVLDCDRSTNFIKSVMPSSLEVVGNIGEPEIVWNYLKKVKETIDEEVFFLQLFPSSYADWKLYSTFCKVCRDKGFPVLGGVGNPIKDFYLFPILQGSPIPTELVFLSSRLNLLENQSSCLLLGIVVVYQRPQEFCNNGTTHAAVPYKLIKIDTSVDKATSISNTSAAYPSKNRGFQKPFPIDTKNEPSASSQPLNRATITRQKLQQDILQVDPIKINVNSNSAQQFAKTGTPHWSRSHKSVTTNAPLAVVNQDSISVPVYGESRMRNAMLKGLNRQTTGNQFTSRSTEVTSTSPEIPGSGDRKPVSKDSIVPIPNYEGQLSQVKLQKKPFAEEKIPIVTQHLVTVMPVTDSNLRRLTRQSKSEPLVANNSTDSANPQSIKSTKTTVKLMLGDSATSNVANSERRRKDNLDFQDIKSSEPTKSRNLPVSSSASTLRPAKSKAKFSQTPPKLKVVSRTSKKLINPCISKLKVSRKRSPESSNEDETPSKVVKSNSETIRTISRTSLKEALWGRCQKANDLETEEAIVEQVAIEIEESLYSFLNKDVGAKYKNKYRSLIYNIKDPKNPELFRDVITKKISPDQLVKMSTEEYAYKSLAEWREKEAKLQLDLIEKNETEKMSMPNKLVIKTHKGEMVIEDTEEDLDEHAPMTKTVSSSLPASFPEILQDVMSKRKSHLHNRNSKISIQKVNKRDVDRVVSHNRSTQQKICKKNFEFSTNDKGRGDLDEKKSMVHGNQQSLRRPPTSEGLHDELQSNEDYEEKNETILEENVPLASFSPEFTKDSNEAQTAVETHSIFGNATLDALAPTQNKEATKPDEKLLEEQHLMEELNTALPAWLAIRPQGKAEHNQKLTSVGNNLVSPTFPLDDQSAQALPEKIGNPIPVVGRKSVNSPRQAIPVQISTLHSARTNKSKRPQIERCLTTVLFHN